MRILGKKYFALLIIQCLFLQIVIIVGGLTIPSYNISYNLQVPIQHDNTDQSNHNTSM